MSIKPQSTTEPIEVPERIWIAPTTIRKREGRIYLAPGRKDNEIEYRVHVPADSGNVEDEPDIYDLVADYRDRIGMQTCAHCANPITGGATPNTWVHIGTGLTTCRKYGASAHEGIFNAEPATTARVSASVAPTVDDGISWSALLAVLERLRSKNRNPDNEWYHGWNAAIQCLINDINARTPAAASPVAQSDDGWVTFGRVKVDIENETQTFERIHPPVNDRLCLLCGHNGVAPDGTCMVPVSICPDGHYDGTSRRCGCRCSFKTAPAPSAAIQDEQCKCGLDKDDPIHSFSTEWQQMHKFTPRSTALNLSSLARKAAEEIAPALATYECPWCRVHPHREPCCFQCASARDDKRLRAERVDQITAIIERCLSEGEA